MTLITQQQQPFTFHVYLLQVENKYWSLRYQIWINLIYFDIWKFELHLMSLMTSIQQCQSSGDKWWVTIKSACVSFHLSASDAQLSTIEYKMSIEL